MADIDKLQKELDYYKKMFGASDIATRAYQSAIGILEQQITFLNKFKIEEEIKKTTKEDATYGRASDMWEKMPKMIGELHKLKNELGIEYVEEDTREMSINPQSVGTHLISR